MKTLQSRVDAEEAAFAAWFGDILDDLCASVEEEEEAGVSRTEIAQRSKMHKSQLSRILNGRQANITLRTISTILYALDKRPNRFQSRKVAEISPNHFDQRQEIPNITATFQIKTFINNGPLLQPESEKVKSVRTINEKARFEYAL